MSNNELTVWRADWTGIGLAAFVCAITYVIFSDGLEHMVNVWDKKEEYGHGYMIPFIAAFLIWQKKDILERIEFSGSWKGVYIILAGLLLFFAGELASHFAFIQYGFIVVVYGVILSFLGVKAFKVIFIPLAILLFMIPLPNFIFNTLSTKLQLISSEIGVAVIRLFDISVYLEGNVIDLGSYKLQVVEACSGLNYLFPLMTLGFITAYFFAGEFWKKAVIFLSTIPITVFMNSFRIGVIGVTVEYWGAEMAEGFLHDFEGWAVFMVCIGILLIEMWILAKVGNKKMPLREAFGLDFPDPTPKEATVNSRRIPKQFYVSLVIILLTASSTSLLPDRQEIIPDRKEFAGFPLKLADWEGRPKRLTQNIIDALDVTDYAFINYINSDNERVNFYTAYYASQRKGEAIHSPRACIPGGGWEIASIGEYTIDDVYIGGKPLKVRRLLITKDGMKQLVYYWFQQRGRILTHEYQLKLYLLYDSITMQRTDGALIRLTTVLKPQQEIAIADNRLKEFSKHMSNYIPDYVPD